MPFQVDLGQAVILCGGLGTRLRPLTDNLPKPMAPVNGRPFLHHLMTQLSGQGIKRFVLLTGYLGEKIREYFGDGSRWEWSITYSHGPAEWDTGRRIWEARGELDPRFLLLYSDNFAQFNMHRLCSLAQTHDVPICLLLAPKDRGNIRVSVEGRVMAYDKTRSGESFDHVEIGYMLINRDPVLGDFPRQERFPDFNFSDLLQQFARQSLIAGLVVRDRYHSISDPVRLKAMCEYLRPKRVLLIDRDGTINKKAPRGEYVSNWSKFEWIPETRRAMKNLAMDGFQFVVITNQAGIARQMITTGDLQEIHGNMTRELAEAGIEVLRVYVSPHHWDENSFMRKPSPGMFFEAASDFNLRMDRCLYIGDDERDCEAARNAGCGMVYIGENRDTSLLAEFPSPHLTARTLEDSVEDIKNIYHGWEAAA